MLGTSIRRSCAASMRALQCKSKVFTSINTVLGKQSFSSNPDSFLSGSSSVYVEQMYTQWKKEPASVHASWQR